MTAPTMDAAETVVGSLLDERLIACGSMIPGVESLYRWKGAVHRDEEVVVIMKTVRRLVPRVLERARALHPYDVPELLVQEVVDGNPAYLDWVEEECG
ncbi:MAG: divalent-cation tolerance protein CutA [Gemmatimonadetes bacterium]|nr:divalent-cation tolerance protein CutA [Gemmatimonadota bacterium]MYH51740.1 divalent-cation tolerance protein CutA [Gemmatimonadota bacterium]MYK67685.1 divalent-cation tolerance protein CutA [Gemmatimonadota bacterium]